MGKHRNAWRWLLAVTVLVLPTLVLPTAANATPPYYGQGSGHGFVSNSYVLAPASSFTGYYLGSTALQSPGLTADSVQYNAYCSPNGNPGSGEVLKSSGSGSTYSLYYSTQEGGMNRYLKIQSPSPSDAWCATYNSTWKLAEIDVYNIVPSTPVEILDWYENPAGGGCPAVPTDIQAGLSGTTVNVSAKVPSGGQIFVWAPDPGSSSIAAPTFQATNTVVGAPGYLSGSTTVSGTPTTVRVAAINAATCGVAVNLSSGAITPGPTTYGATNPDDGTSDCGFNPFCYIKAALVWAFNPSGVTSAWSSFESAVESHFPFSIVTTGITFATGIVNGYDSPASAPATSFGGGSVAIPGEPGNSFTLPTMDPLGSSAGQAACVGSGDTCPTGHTGILGDSSVGLWVDLFYKVLEVGIFVAAGFVAFKMIAAAFSVRSAAVGEA